MPNDKLLLENHGTKLMELKPSTIWSTAMEDLKRRENNRHDSGNPAKMKHYAFHRDHVKKAESANDVIRAALNEPEKGRRSTKYNTRLIYSDLDLLRSALR